MNFYLSKKISSTIELPNNEPLPFKQKNVFNHRITIKWTFTFQTKNVLYHRITIQWTFTFKQKKCLQPSNYHKMNLYLSNKKMFSTIELPYNEPLPFKQKNVFNHRITIQWTFTFQTKECLQPPNYHTMNFYLSKKNVFHHRITIQWTFTFQMKKLLQPSNYHPMNLYISNKKTSSTIELSYNEPLPFKQKNVFNERITIQWTFTFQTKKTSSTIELPYNEPLPFKRKYVFNHRITIKWTFTFQTKKCFQPSNYHTMNLYISTKKTSSTIELPSNEPLHFK